MIYHRFIRQVMAKRLDLTIVKACFRTVFATSLYRNAVYLILSTAIQSITGFFFWAIAARLYSNETVGLSAAAISAIGLLATLSTLGLNFGIVRFLPVAKDEARDMINSSLTLGGLVSLALAVIFILGIDVWAPALRHIRDISFMSVVFIAAVLATTLAALVERVFLAMRKTSISLMQGILFDVSRFVPLVIMASLMPAFGILASWGLAILILTGASVLLLIPRVQRGYSPRPVVSRTVIARMLSFSSMNYLGNVCTMLPQLAVPIIVLNRLGSELNAYSFVAWSIGGVLFAIPAAVGLSLFAEGSHNNASLVRNAARGMVFTMVITVPMVIGILLLGDWVLRLFGDDYAAGASILLKTLGISALPCSVNAIYFGIERVRMRMKRVVILSFVIAVLTLVMSYFMLPRIGVAGSGLAWLTANSLVALGIAWAFLRQSDKMKTPGQARWPI